MHCEQVLSRLDDSMDAKLAMALSCYFTGVRQKSVDARFMTKPRNDRLQITMRGMHPGLRAIISLYYVDGYSLNEISKLLEEPVGTLEYRLHSAQAYLREKLMEPFDENDRGR